MRQKRILLLDCTGEEEADLLVLLKLSGYEVESFSDALVAVNRYQLVADTEQAFSLAVVVDSADRTETALLTKSFKRLLLLTRGYSGVRVFREGCEVKNHSRPGELAALIAAESC